jgi:DNA-binding response OmpR family regulator
MSMLLVESDPLLAVTLPAMLTGKGYCVHVVRGISEGEDGILAQGHDLILIDVMPPDRRGTELCRSLRRQGVAVPIMMLSESDATADKVAALDAGADDCLTKPYQLEELLARLRSLVRRWQATGVSELRCGDLIMDLIRRDVTLVGAAIKLTTKELVLLEYMMRNPAGC